MIKFFYPLRNPKIAGSILLGSALVALPLSIADNKITNNKLDRVYFEIGGTNSNLSVNEKVDFIRSQPMYTSTNSYASFLNRIKPIK